MERPLSMLHTGATGAIPFLLLFLLCPAAISQQLHTYIDRDSVRTGDLFHYILVLQSEGEFRTAEFPDQNAFNSEELHFVDRSRYGLDSGRDSVVYRLQFFGVEDFRISRKEVILTRSDGDSTVVRSTEVPIFFSSVLAEDDEEFRPLKPIFDFAASIWPWILLLMFLLSVGWYLYRRFQQRDTAPEKESPPAPPLPFNNPINLLEEELEYLSGQQSPLKDDDYDQFYIRLGDAIRRYFEEVYRIRALEMTSREILDQLYRYHAETEILESSRKVLFEADMVKFAKFEPGQEQASRALDLGRQFLETVRRVDQPLIDAMRQRHDDQQQESHPVAEDR